MPCLRTNLAIDQSFRSCTYTLVSTPPPRGLNNWACFCSMGNGFWDMGWFSKLPYSGMKLSHWPKFQKLHIYSLSTPRGGWGGGEGWSKLGLFLLYRQRFQRYGWIFKLAIFGHETWPLAKVPEIAHILPFYSRGAKLSFIQSIIRFALHHSTIVLMAQIWRSLFSLYRQRFLRYGLIFQLAVFGQKLHL